MPQPIDIEILIRKKIDDLPNHAALQAIAWGMYLLLDPKAPAEYSEEGIKKELRRKFSGQPIDRVYEASQHMIKEIAIDCAAFGRTPKR